MTGYEKHSDQAIAPCETATSEVIKGRSRTRFPEYHGNTVKDAISPVSFGFSACMCPWKSYSFGQTKPDMKIVFNLEGSDLGQSTRLWRLMGKNVIITFCGLLSEFLDGMGLRRPGSAEPVMLYSYAVRPGGFNREFISAQNWMGEMELSTTFRSTIHACVVVMPMKLKLRNTKRNVSAILPCIPEKRPAVAAFTIITTLHFRDGFRYIMQGLFEASRVNDNKARNRE
ncbi:hypothetical protein CIRG_08013 [Coccidioides immitis RMSCC 2394]|uniref:Uncharacterized protein n=1 Tax=Coccidioides immitis RMSCC 2394 TaxID=404692 RepID=A0A0J7BDX0_COCIT|nr:hypothetical protein CIRG_08013 [Coccidioides immitis RMSCC 2394]